MAMVLDELRVALDARRELLELSRQPARAPNEVIG
jgi:hypothetical protein